MPRVSRLTSTIAASFLLAFATGPATAQETTLQNDSFVDGQAVGFQAGFVTGEIAASRFLPGGSPAYVVKRIQLLFGGSLSPETITLRIWDDAAGTTNPGLPIFSGDFGLTGSNTVLQEIDLTSSNVIVYGQFRVGIEFQHDGLPSAAQDLDGNIQTTRNFIYVDGLGWFQSNLLGLTGDWVLRAVVAPAPAGPLAPPQILSIADVGNDQGRQVRLRFVRSDRDALASPTPILTYEVLRRVEQGSLASATKLPSLDLAGWDYVTSIAAHGDSIYSVVVPTLRDSSVAQGLQWSAFRVRATTSVPLSFFESAADSGYSVDNLPPVPPAAFAAEYANGATHLTWNPNAEPDLWYYRLHRGGSAAFVPGPGNLIATSAALGHDDPGPAGRYYKLAAVDVNGNVGGYALVTPQGTLGVAIGDQFEMALSVAGTHPLRGDRVVLACTLPAASTARLELLDVTGRRVASRELSEFGAGRHTVELSPGRKLAPGIYLARLSQADQQRSLRVVVTE